MAIVVSNLRKWEEHWKIIIVFGTKIIKNSSLRNTAVKVRKIMWALKLSWTHYTIRTRYNVQVSYWRRLQKMMILEWRILHLKFQVLPVLTCNFRENQ